MHIQVCFHMWEVDLRGIRLCKLRQSGVSKSWHGLVLLLAAEEAHAKAAVFGAHGLGERLETNRQGARMQEKLQNKACIACLLVLCEGSWEGAQERLTEGSTYRERQISRSSWTKT